MLYYGLALASLIAGMAGVLVPDWRVPLGITAIATFAVIWAYMRYIRPMTEDVREIRRREPIDHAGAVVITAYTVNKLFFVILPLTMVAMMWVARVAL